MPLLRTTNRNPVSPILPQTPAAASATPEAPAQGDHVFGDILGAIRTALEKIFGSGLGLDGRIAAYNKTLSPLWTGMQSLDLGHGPQQPVVQRRGLAEPDEHAWMFGGYARILQWRMAEIVDTGFAGGARVLRIGGATNLWKRQVKSALEDLLLHSIDETALRAYVQAPGTIRQANPAQDRHRAISPNQALMILGQIQGPGRAGIQGVLGRWGMLPNSVMGLIDRLDGPTQKFDYLLNGWVPERG